MHSRHKLFLSLVLTASYFAGSQTYMVLEGGRADLPCDLNVTSAEDEVTLILWHREDSGSPVYSVDARDRVLSSARHFPSPKSPPGHSSMCPASPSADHRGNEENRRGVYRCRVEYRRSRTETTDALLTVIGKNNDINNRQHCRYCLKMSV
ncbi:ig-like domain-containing protein [Caerostris extrusa]|uniref:Ig-like domain-containing protein n=1 Tax=Caerostris extrusa TaxID=172846 RepID=A0AAV4WM28_CAEEX|nr:ig-like domain-containing protein [Caerostris extrusa]